MRKRWWCVLKGHEWGRLQGRSEEAYRCRRCGKYDFPELWVDSGLLGGRGGRESRLGEGGGGGGPLAGGGGGGGGDGGGGGGGG